MQSRVALRTLIFQWLRLIILLHWAKRVKWLLWEKVEYSDFNHDWEKGCQLLTSPNHFLLIKCRFLPFSYFYALSNPVCCKTIVLFTFFLYFLNIFSFVCTFTCCLFVLVLFCFRFLCLVCSVKTPRKAVLFHEYQVSTGRVNKFVSLLAIFLSLSWPLSLHVCLCVTWFNYRPPMLRKYVLLGTFCVRVCVQGSLFVTWIVIQV